MLVFAASVTSPNGGMTRAEGSDCRWSYAKQRLAPQNGGVAYLLVCRFASGTRVQPVNE